MVVSGRIQLVFLLLVVSTCVVKGTIVNQNVDRVLDLSTQLVKVSLKITAQETNGELIKKYEVHIPEPECQKLTFMAVKDGFNKDLKFHEEKLADRNQYTLVFHTPATTQIINIDLVFSKSILPHPEEIKQSERQLVKYIGNLYFYSPYRTLSQKTFVKLSSSTVVSYTQVKPYTLSANKLEYGPYEKIEPKSNQSLMIHYENHSPFLTVKLLERTIEVSHWGNIAVKENIFLEHPGARLKGSFSRYEFQKDTRSGQSAIKSYKTWLPASASGVYYRDSNGNISTSNMKVLRDAVELELRPRFPLFGGWKTNYVLGYNVPSFEYLFHSNENYLLRMRTIDHIYDDMVIDEAIVKIILPEGSRNIELSTPFSVIRKANELHFTYLDTIGRPVVSFSKRNLTEFHMSDFNLKYTFSTVSLLQEPILVVSFIFIIFIVTIISLRLDFSITAHHHKE